MSKRTTIFLLILLSCAVLCGCKHEDKNVMPATTAQNTSETTQTESVAHTETIQTQPVINGGTKEETKSETGVNNQDKQQTEATQNVDIREETTAGNIADEEQMDVLQEIQQSAEFGSPGKMD